MLQWITNIERVRGRALSALCVGAAALSLSGCLSGVQYASDNQLSAVDYRDRHPIVIGKRPNTLDLFPVGGRLDTLSADKLRAFAARYREFEDRSLASPVRLVFQGLKAEVATRCGQWPADLASGTSLETWKNEGYENFGCATQSALASQIDDPRDLVQGRGSTPPDENMRLRAIQQVRKGQDPGTDWKVQITPIGQVGG